jgi:antitoxin YefM
MVTNYYYIKEQEAFMYSTYRLKAEELTNEFVKSVKHAYHDKEIEIIIQDVQDETEYLLSSIANKEHLLKSVAEIKNKENLVTVNMEEL